MKKILFESKLGRLTAKNILLKFFVVVIGITELWNSYKIDKAMHYQRTVLIPANLDQRVTIVDDNASESYIKSFARLITNLAFNYNTSSARGQFGELLQLFSSDTFPSAKQGFYSLADTIEHTKLSSSFVINKPIDVDLEKKTIIVTGALRQWVESQFIDTTEKTYIISYAMSEGRFLVTGLSEKTTAKSDQSTTTNQQQNNAKLGAVPGGSQNAK